MKLKFRKLISSLLILASLISMMTVFVYAADGEGEEDPNVLENGVSVLLNRTFDEGWSLKNGASALSGAEAQIVALGEEEKLDGTKNRYMDLGVYESTTSAYVQYTVSDYTKGAGLGGFVLEFDLKSFDGSANGSILYGRTGAGQSGVDNDYTLLSVTNGMVVSGGVEICPLPDYEWVHFAFIYDYSTYDNNYINISVVFDGKVVNTIKISGSNNASPNPNPAFFRFHIPMQKNVGDSIAYDNIKMYTGTTEITEIPVGVYGALVNSGAVFDAPISSDEDTVSVTEALATSLMMKVGVDYALAAGERVPLMDDGDGSRAYGSPEKVDGVVMLPIIPLLDYMGVGYYEHKNGLSFDIATSTGTTYVTVGRTDAIVNGEVLPLTAAPGYLYSQEGKGYALVAMDDVEKLFPGWYITYDDMGLIVFARADNVLDRSAQLADMCNYMKQFVFDLPDAERLYNDLKEGTNNFDHPYIYGNQEEFDHLYELYLQGNTDLASLSEDDQLLYSYIVKMVNSANVRYTSIAAYSEDGGYDPNTFKVTYAPAADYGLLVGDFRLLSDGTFQYAKGEGDYVISQMFYPINPYATHNLDPADKDPETGFLSFVSNDCTWGIYSLNTTYARYTRTNSATATACGRSHLGYDCDGARLSESAAMGGIAQYLAFGYQLTRNEDYALLAYNILAVLAKWEQWGPAHTLNGAEASSAFATALDWCWDIFKDMSRRGVTDYIGQPVDPEWLMDQLWEHGTSMAYRSCIMRLGTAFPRADSDYSSYYDATNNWNGVCNGNLSIAIMVNLSDGDDIPAPNATVPNQEGYTIKKMCSESMAYQMYAIVTWGIDIYAPDGAYVEGPGYWGYGTNQMTEFWGTLAKATGYDYGYFDTWGFDKTFHYSAYVEAHSSLRGTYRNFNYNDNNVGTADSSTFFVAATYMNMPELATLRHMHMANGKGASYFDVMWFVPPSSLDGDVELELEYSSDGLDLFTTRSSWDSDALFAGMVCGYALTSHGHLDTGSWVYYNQGIEWIVDPGSESYNVYNDHGDNRYRYYKLSAEGHNSIILTTQQANMPYGTRQDATAYAPTIRIDGELHYTNEHGSYAMFDMTDLYAPNASGKRYAYSAHRGMLLTNDRSTLVVQDEFILNGMETLYWYAHINAGTDHKISEDGKTLYLISGGKTIRMTLVSQDNDALKFQVWENIEDKRDATTPNGGYILDNIHPMNSNEYLGGVRQGDRNGKWKKIVIEAKDILFLDLAVVVEEVTDTYSTAPVCYKYTKMSAWEPYEAGLFSSNVTVPDESDVEIRTSKDPQSEIVLIINNSLKAESYYNSEVAFSTELANFYSLLTDTEWFVRLIGGSGSLSAIYKPYYDKIADLSGKYMTYRDKMNANMDVAKSISTGLITK